MKQLYKKRTDILKLSSSRPMTVRQGLADYQEKCYPSLIGSRLRGLTSTHTWAKRLEDILVFGSVSGRESSCIAGVLSRSRLKDSDHSEEAKDRVQMEHPLFEGIGEPPWTSAFTSW